MRLIPRKVHMRARAVMIGFLLNGLWFIACSDDSAEAAEDKEFICNDSIDNDTDGQTDCDDNDCVNHSECGGSGWTCQEIYTCSQSCVMDNDCIDTCKANGCQSAQESFAELCSCISSLCSYRCNNDPTAKTCTDCIEDECKNSLTDCQSNTC